MKELSLFKDDYILDDCETKDFTSAGHYESLVRAQTCSSRSLSMWRTM